MRADRSLVAIVRSDSRVAITMRPSRPGAFRVHDHPHGQPHVTISPREQRRQSLFLTLAGVFLGNALLAELIGGKLFQVPTGVHLSSGEEFKFTLSCGVILWPVVFVTSDIINEYFGRA